MLRTLALDPVFKALADPRRRWYVEAMVDGRVRLLEFAEMFPITLPTVLHHLRILEQSGLVSSYREGPMKLYVLRPEGLLEAEAWLRGVLWAGHRPKLGSLPQDWGLQRR